jgi:hypothetical protein
MKLLQDAEWSHWTDREIERPRVPLLFVLAQYFAGLPVDQVQLGAGEAGDHLIFVFGHVLIVVQPMLDFHRCRRAGENERGHHKNMTALRRQTVI